MKALKMKNPPHPGFLVRVDCLEPAWVDGDRGGEGFGCIAVSLKPSGE